MSARQPRRRRSPRHPYALLGACLAGVTGAVVCLVFWRTGSLPLQPFRALIAGGLAEAVGSFSFDHIVVWSIAWSLQCPRAKRSVVLPHVGDARELSHLLAVVRSSDEPCR